MKAFWLRKSSMWSGVTVLALALATGLGPGRAMAQAQAGDGQAVGQGQGMGMGAGQGMGQGMGGGMRGMGMMGNGRGVMGTVTAVAADHYLVKTDAGEEYTVFFSANTRLMKQPARPVRGGAGSGAGPGAGERPTPEMLRPTPIKADEIKVGDAVMAGGEMDTTKKTLGAVMVMELDAERAQQMRAMEAAYGKTWLAGRVTAIEETRITVDGITDHVGHSFVVDENTSFRRRRESITLADIKVGDQLRAEGGVKDGVFVATMVQAMMPARQPGQPGQMQPQPQPQPQN